MEELHSERDLFDLQVGESTEDEGFADGALTNWG